MTVRHFIRKAGIGVGVVCASAVLLSPASAGARPLTCNPQSTGWTFETNNWNTPPYVKNADGCAQPWLVLYGANAKMEAWVNLGGGDYINGGVKNCTVDQVCNLWPGWEWNGYPFHIQDVSKTEDDAFIYY